MKTNNTFSINRFALLFKQNMIHNYKLVSQSLIAFCGGLFIILLIIQFSQKFQPQSLRSSFVLFVILFFGTGIICSGTGFPALRTKEGSHNYLMNPASVFEKYIMELFSRILLFILIVPLLYWAVYNVEGYVVKLFYPAFSFEGPMLFPFQEINMATETATLRMSFLFLTGGLLLLVIPFTGSTIFYKSPVIKTLFAVAIIFFFNLFMVYIFMEILDFRQYYPTRPVLFMRHLEDVLMASIVASIVFIIGLILAAYFKLKEREV